jgi:predicted MPP superfamily phosphohydrolase
MEFCTVILLIIVALIIVFFAYMNFEAGWVQITRIDFRKDRTSKNKCLKLLHLSDIHIEYLKVSVEKTRHIIDNEKPDAIIITGDHLISGKRAGEFISYLSFIMGDYPTFICLGNHEYKAFRNNHAGFLRFLNDIRKTGARLLINDTAPIYKNKKRYDIIGLDDYREGIPDIETAMSSCSSDSVRIMIAHNPDQILEMSPGQVDYLFTGHFHGGQIRMPFRFELYIRRKDKLDKKGVIEGLHTIKGINMYINRGLGNSVVPLRFLARPEISVYIIP